MSKSCIYYANRGFLEDEEILMKFFIMSFLRDIV